MAAAPCVHTPSSSLNQSITLSPLAKFGQAELGVDNVTVVVWASDQM